MTKVFNRTTELNLRRTLRREMPPAERLLWSRLRGQQLGFRFRRQYSVGRFCIDFYCPEIKLAIELDGPTHFEPGVERFDAEREAFVAEYGIAFLRFTNVEIYQSLDAVLERILSAAQRRQSGQSENPT